ncbi:MAG: hypothetical protein H0W85_04945 [Methylotenera sp.]|nr:hypothetical protein [Methylotenera sp.]
MDDISAIEYSAQQLNNELKNNVFKDELFLQALFSIDEKTHTIVERVTNQYITIENIGIELEERLTSSVFLYHRQMFLIYLAIIENFGKDSHPCLLLMLARAINRATQMIKWRYYTYNSAPASVWLQISQLYKIAENQFLLEQAVQIYDDQPSTTITIAYIQVCMLGSLESLSFKRQQIELVSKMLHRWASKVVIESTYDEKRHLFYVDTVNNVPAKRIRNFKPADSYRYWCFDSINSKIELCASALEFNISPKQLAMEEFSCNKYFVPTLDVLRTEWSRSDYKRQRRNEERTKTVKSATTSYGFVDTCYQIKQYENLQVQRGEKTYQGEKSFEERLASHYVVKGRAEPNIIYVDLGAGYSNIIDESSKGIGMHISKQANEVSLGMMVGVSLKEQKYGTRVGVIRSIKPAAGNELQIGVEVLSRNAFCVEAKNASMSALKLRGSVNNTDDISADFSSSTSKFTCLFLPEEFGVSTGETLIVPRIQYNSSDVFQLNILGAEMTVKFTDTLERHEDWIRVVYSQDIGKMVK